MITWYINFKSSSNPDRKCLQKRTIIVSIFWIDRSPWNGPNPVFTVIYKSALVIIHLFCRTYERKVSSIKYLKYKCSDLEPKASAQTFFKDFELWHRSSVHETFFLKNFGTMTNLIYIELATSVLFGGESTRGLEFWFKKCLKEFKTKECKTCFGKATLVPF